MWNLKNKTSYSLILTQYTKKKKTHIKNKLVVTNEEREEGRDKMG